MLKILRKIAARGGGTGSATSVGVGWSVGVDSGVLVGRGVAVAVGLGVGIGVGQGVGGGTAVRVADTAVPTFLSNSRAVIVGDLVGETVEIQAGAKRANAAVALARATNLRKKTFVKEISPGDRYSARPTR
jgi:hypothetical protein